MDESAEMQRAGTIRRVQSSLLPVKAKARGRRGRAPPNQGGADLDQTQGTGQEGRGAEEAAAGEGPTKESECLDILCGGYVQSFVDFFYLTHRPDPNPGVNAEGAAPEIQVPGDDMAFMRGQLTRAEAARRIGETRTVFDCYSALARYFQDHRDTKTGIYFLEKCHEIARLTGDLAGEMQANHQLGRAHEALGDLATATQFHERHMTLAQESGEGAETEKAAQELLLVYRSHAEEMEQERAFDAAAELHERCLEACRLARDRVAEGLANYRLGRCLVLLERPSEALPYLEEYLAIAQELEDVEGAGAAHSALAAALQALDKVGDAVQHLEQFLAIARETDDTAAQAEACANLGIIYNRRGEYAKAVDYFRKNFDVCRTMLANKKGERARLDRARVHLGMALGNLQMGQYLHVITTDVRALLKWKTKRVALPKQGR